MRERVMLGEGVLDGEAEVVWEGGGLAGGEGVGVPLNETLGEALGSSEGEREGEAVGVTRGEAVERSVEGAEALAGWVGMAVRDAVDAKEGVARLLAVPPGAPGLPARPKEGEG